MDYYLIVIFLKMILMGVLAYFILKILDYVHYKINERKANDRLRENIRRKFNNPQ